MSDMTASYSPDDNKLRLYSTYRLDAETYERVKAAGFAWAPKQQLFVAPKWTPERADLLIDLCGEIGDEDTSLVDRAEERADRFDGYQMRRAADAESARRAVAAIADNIPFGQPILVGHHSEARARRDAKRIQAGMRRAVDMWETSEYWQRRAAGALANARYKERPDVRARRIKVIEADLRRAQKSVEESARMVRAWLKVPRLEWDRQTAAARYIAGRTGGGVSLYSALEKGMHGDTAWRLAVDSHERWIARHQRWIEHYEHRLSYERAMLDEQGGIVADRFDIEVGGTVLVRGEWLIVTRVNKAGGRISSVSTNCRYVRVKSIEEINDYRAPDPEQAAKVKAATKVAPLANYAGEGFAHITQAQWDAIPKDYRTTKTIPATETTPRHRVRVALGVYVLANERDVNKRYDYPFVFITDAKALRPAAAAVAAPKPEPLPAPVPAYSKPLAIHRAPAPTDFDRMREQLREGVKVVSAPQLFPTPPHLAARMVDLAGVWDSARILEPSAGTGRIVQALRDTGRPMHIVAVEVNRELSDLLYRNYQCKPTDIAQEVEVVTADFLSIKSGVGVFDVAVMNPPFENGADVKHITHALTLVRPGGRLVAICAGGPRQEAVLRPLAEQSGGLWEPLPEGTFSEAGTNVRSVLMVVEA